MTNNRRALITGITGQDGSYLAEFLLNKGYEVHGIIRRSSSFNTARIDPIYEDPHFSKAKLKLHYGDLCDGSSLSEILRRVRPHEVYNLGAQSHVRVSFDMPIFTADTVAMGALRLLDALEAARAQHLDHARHVVVVHLAAERLDEDATRRRDFVLQSRGGHYADALSRRLRSAAYSCHSGAGRRSPN